METLSSAHAVTLQPGDALFIPQNWYHVLENLDFSVTLGIASYEKKRTELLISFLTDALAECYNENPRLTLNTPLPDNTNEYASSIAPTVLKDTNLVQIAEKGLSQLLDRLKSNHYFKYTSPVRNLDCRTYRYFGELVIGDRDKETTRIYFRGRDFIVRNKFQDNLFTLRDLVSSKDFKYKRDENHPDNFLHFFLNKMVNMGVLV